MCSGGKEKKEAKKNGDDNEPYDVINKKDKSDSRSLKNGDKHTSSRSTLKSHSESKTKMDKDRKETKEEKKESPKKKQNVNLNNKTYPQKGKISPRVGTESRTSRASKANYGGDRGDGVRTSSEERPSWNNSVSVRRSGPQPFGNLKQL